MKIQKRALALAAVLLLGAAAIAAYTVWTPISDVTITSHNDYAIVLAGSENTLTCTTSTDIDCNTATGQQVVDTVTHTWSGPGTFSPQTGTSITWTAPTAPGQVTLYVMANDSPLANDSPKMDDVILIVQNIIYVDQDAAGSNNGTTWANAFTDLQDALEIATAATEIWIAEGTYKPSIQSEPGTARTETFQLVSGVKMYGGFDPDNNIVTMETRDPAAYETILSGDIGTQDDPTDNCYHVLQASSPITENIIDGLTITAGNANHPENYYEFINGSGMYIRGAWDYDPNAFSSLELSNCKFIYNHASGGGSALYAVFMSEMNIANCSFVENTGDGMLNGGAVMTFASHALAFTGCKFIDNESGYEPAGLYLAQDSPDRAGHAMDPVIIDSCHFIGNTAGSSAGAAMIRAAADTFVTNCVFAENTATYGSALNLYPVTNNGLVTTIMNCTISGNTSTSPYNNGAAVHSMSFGTAEIVNSIIRDDERAVSGTFTATYSNIEGGCAGTGNIDADPSFVNPSNPLNGGLRLKSDSSCIDAGTASGAPAADIAGRTRDANPDMGAYEYDPSYIIYVDQDASGSNNGTTWANAYTDLQDALDIATAGNEIWIAEGTYKPSKLSDPTLPRSATFQIISGVKMYGGFDPGNNIDTWQERDWNTYETILSGDIGTENNPTDNCLKVLYSDNAGLCEGTTVDGLTITKAYNDLYLGEGGGLWLWGGGSPTVDNLTVRNCSFQYNEAEDGAAIFNHMGHVTIDHCQFISNTTANLANDGYGGAIHIFLNGSGTVSNCIFNGNTAHKGGGIAASSSEITVTDCVFIENTAYIGGGGMYAQHSHFTVWNCVFANNSALGGYAGGAFSSYGASAYGSITNCSVYGNSGGGISALFNSPSITNCILWANSSWQIWAYNSSPQVTYCDIQGGYSGTGNINSNPFFVNSSDLDGPDNLFLSSDDGLMLSSGSPCINSGNSSAAPALDILGSTRDSYADMGAYEY